MKAVLYLALCTLFNSINADLYVHNPRGSNNRLNEKSAQRANANRLFDSQNNNRGGYNVCDCDPVNGFLPNSWMANAHEKYDWRFLYKPNSLRKQYEEIYFEDSNLSVTWTNQHGLANKKLLSQVILQFGCDTVMGPPAANRNGFGVTTSVGGACVNDECTNNNLRKVVAHGLRMELMNGGNTGTPGAPGNIGSTYAGNNRADRGRHESEEYYYLCKFRSRQKGLFHADQNLNNDKQTRTRQNAGGTRRGLECPEERDYYPWWNPSPWHDVAVFTHDMGYCQTKVAPFSQNVAAKCQCLNPAWKTGNSFNNFIPNAKKHAENNLDQAKCTASGGSWSCFKWNGQPPECVKAPWTRVNHLGNADKTSRGGRQAAYDWKLPKVDNLVNNHFCHLYKMAVNKATDYAFAGDATTNIECVRMVTRMRYNISTADYDPYKTTSEYDYDKANGILSPIENDPEVAVSRIKQALRLAINTAQTGRTFQDRSHTFLVCKRPNNAPWKDKLVLNVNVRGKRGNIVQTFPATEYDFEPQHIEIKPGQCMHYQWCGSNTHNNGAPGGDGQTGDAGEGRGGSDRSNLVQSKNMDESFPLAYDKIQQGVYDFFKDHVDCYYPLKGTKLSHTDAQLNLGTGGFYKSRAYMETVLAKKEGTKLVDRLLNNVSASYRVGLVCCVKNGAVSEGVKKKEFSFICTRNNNFTNRSQKLKIIITSAPDDPMKW